MVLAFITVFAVVTVVAVVAVAVVVMVVAVVVVTVATGVTVVSRRSTCSCSWFLLSPPRSTSLFISSSLYALLSVYFVFSLALALQS